VASSVKNRQAAAKKVREVSGATAKEILRELPFGLVMTDPTGAVLAMNDAARRLLFSAGDGAAPDGATCCSVLGCNQVSPLERHCISDLAATSEGPLPELRVDVPVESPTTAVWVTATPLPTDGLVMLHLRQGSLNDRRRRTQPHWMGLPRLRIRALGRTVVETGEITIEGDWLLQRPGQILKYLVVHRHRPVHVDEIVEALWPRAGRAGRNTVRHFVHALRDRLEPERAPRRPSSFIHSTKGTYSLARPVEIDVGEFESLVTTGLERPGRTREEREVAIGYLESAVELYRGDLFTEEPFADWAFAERERLRTLLHEALLSMTALLRENGRGAAAVKHLARCADYWPLDAHIQRALIQLYIELGRHSDAQRRYEVFRQRMRVDFAQEPEFRLADFGGQAPN
jgi:DNA-binding SARP family transcriptional activator